MPRRRLKGSVFVSEGQRSPLGAPGSEIRKPQVRPCEGACPVTENEPLICTSNEATVKRSSEEAEQTFLMPPYLGDRDLGPHLRLARYQGVHHLRGPEAIPA